MFKKYRFEWGEGAGRKDHTDFYVHSKGTRSGFMHRACVIGPLPRLDEMGNDWDQYKRNEDVLFSKRVAKVSYCNRTWESYGGQTCLSRLWDQLSGLKFVDMSQVSQSNPFASCDEPAHEALDDPEDLFGGLSRR